MSLITKSIVVAAAWYGALSVKGHQVFYSYCCNL